MDLIQTAEAARSLAVGERANLDERLPKWRSIIAMEARREAPYEGAPDLAMPTIRGRRDAVVALLSNTLDRLPFFVAKPRGPAAARAATIFEQLLNYELERTGSIYEILRALGEAVDVGTGHLRVDLIDRGNGEYEVQAVFVPLENIYVYPSNTDRLEYLNVFERRYVPVWQLRSEAAEGLLDEEAVNAVTSNRHDWEPIEVWVSWVRWQGRLWVLYTAEGHTLRQEPDPLGLGHPPYVPIRAIRRHGYYGESLAEVLEPLQDAIDAAVNSLVAEAEFKLSPPIVTSHEGLYNQLRSGELAPGAVFLADGPVTPENFQVLQFQLNPAAVQFVELMDRFAEMASFANVQVPGLPDSRGYARTATEISVVASAGTAKLKRMLRSITWDLHRFAKVYWRVLTSTVQGVRFVFGDRLVAVTSAADDIYLEVPDADLDLRTREFADRMLRYGLAVPTELAAQIVANLPVATTELYIPTVAREDVDWAVNGGDTYPEKQLRAQALSQFLPLVQLLPAATQDRRIYNLLRMLLETLDIYNFQDILGEPPDRVDNEVLQTLTAQLRAGANSGGEGV